MVTREALSQQNQQSNIFWMGMVSFFTDMASSIVVPLMPFFLVLILDQGVDKLGLVLAITTLVSYLLRILAGILADRRGRNKPFLILGYGLSAISKPLFGIAEGWGSIAAFVIITLFTFNEAFYLLLGNEYGLELNNILMILILVKGTQMFIGKSIGRFVDSYSIKIQLGLGYGAGLCSLLLLLTSTFEAYLASFLLFGIHEIIMLMAIRTFIGKKASDKGTAYGFLYFAIAIFSALSAYIIGLIWQVYGVDTALQVSAIGMLLAGFVLFKSMVHQTN